MTQTTITTQTIADILTRGERTPETRPVTRAFLKQIAEFLADEIGAIEGDVGTRARTDSRDIQYIDRAFFYLVPELKATYFPVLTVFLFPGMLWWGVYAWGKRTYTESLGAALERLQVAAEHEMRVGVGSFQAQEAWDGGGHVALGTQLTPEEVGAKADVAGLAREIAHDLAQWWRRLQPHLGDLQRELGFDTQQRKLAEPFATLFGSYEEAHEILDFFAETARRTGLRDPLDERFALTLRHRHTVLRMNLGRWMLVDYGGRKKGWFNLALLSELVPPHYEFEPWGGSFAYTERSVQLFLIPKELILAMPDELRVAYEESMVYIGDYFRHWGASRWRTAHRQEIFEALFDREKREALLTGGIPVDGGDTPESPAPSEPYTATDFLQRTHLRPETMEELLGLLEDKRQIVLYGPPGTGKTFVARELGRLMTGSTNPRPEELTLIQFHPAYGYEDFMEGIRPHSREAGEGRFVVDYPVEQGIFRRFCETARELDGRAVLIIDEINRGNIARVFGELMYLLEYRDQEIVLPYSGERFSIPRNVYLIGTMNTADRSIALVDFALRRRFHFFPFRADADLLARWLESHPVDIPYLLPLYQRLSTDAIDDPDYAIGPSYFMDSELTEEKLRRIWERSIMPYLAEYHLDQRQSVDRWRWEGDLVRGIREVYARD